MLPNAELNDIIRRLAEWATTMEVVDYEDAITELVSANSQSGEMAEVITIKWRRRQEA